jgi:ferredoxin
MRIHLEVNPIACAGHGVCAELFPEWIELDEWGYPIIDREPIPEELLVHARRAAAACPKLALTLRQSAVTDPASPGAARTASFRQ